MTQKPKMKEMENKYFTPSLEDIRVGYECEYHGMTAGGLMIIDFSDESKSETIKEPDIKVWSPIKCGYDPWINEKTVEEIKKLLENNRIRTPYLTKEQIEADGWKVKSEQYVNLGWIVYEKGNHWLLFYEKELFIKIIPIDPSLEHSINKQGVWVLYSGECKDINTFRYICKLLNI